MKEGTLSRNIVKAIKDRGGWAYKTHGNRYAQGLPDVVGTYRGYFLGLEVKLPGKERTLTDLQAHTLGQIHEAGGVALVITSVEKVVRIMDSIDIKRDRKKKRTKPR